MESLRFNKLITYCLVLLAVFLWGYQLITLNIGFKDFDESYFAIGMDTDRPVDDSSSSQSYLMIKALPGFLSSNLIGLRILSFLCVFLGSFSIAFAFIYLKRKKGWNYFSSLASIAIIFIFSSFIFTSALYAKTIHYNQLQVFFLYALLALYMLCEVVDKKVKYVLLVGIGLLMSCSIQNIFPSGVLISTGTIVLLFIKNVRQLKVFAQELLFIFIGIILSLILYQVFIRPVSDFFAVIQSSFDSFSTTSSQVVDESSDLKNSYSYLGFIDLVINYCYHVFWIGLFSTISILFFKLLGEKNKYIPALLLFTLCLFFFVGRREFKTELFLVFILFSFLYSLQKSFYIKKISVSTILLLVFLILPWCMNASPDMKSVLFNLIINGIAIFCYIKYTPIRSVLSKKRLYKVAFLLFLLSFPLLSVTGTNMPLEHKTSMFMGCWGILFCISLCKNNSIHNYKLLLFFMVMTVFFVLFSLIEIEPYQGSFRTSTETTYIEKFKSIKITPKQKAELEFVDQTLKDYGYQEGDTVLAFYTNLDYVYAFSANMVAGLNDCYLIWRFISMGKTIPIPDYMILKDSEAELLYASGIISSQHVAENYDIYPIFKTENKIYCLKDVLISKKHSDE